jgi:hypothetical protein
MPPPFSSVDKEPTVSSATTPAAAASTLLVVLSMVKPSTRVPTVDLGHRAAPRRERIDLVIAKESDMEP